MSNFSYGIVTVSDSCHSGESVDTSGPTIKALLTEKLHAFKITCSLVPDEKEQIEEILKYFCDEVKVHCVITTGGTGFAPRDVTPEATRNVIHRECQQLSLKMSLESFKKTEFAALSRAVCGIRDKTLIINLPGSKKAVVECFQAIQSVLVHAIELIRDEKIKTAITHKDLQKESKHPNDSEKVDIRNVDSLISSSSSNMLDIAELLDSSSSSMSEILLDSDIMKLPIRRNIQVNSSLCEKQQNEPEKPLSSSSSDFRAPVSKPKHVCPHKTANADDNDDRNSKFPMLSVDDALNKIFASISKISEPIELLSPMNCPPFRASIKDGYAVKSCSKSKKRKVVGYVSAGDKIVRDEFLNDECYKINTGAPVPLHADAIVQIEDTKLLSTNDSGVENFIELLQLPTTNLDIREIGSDVSEGEFLFRTCGMMDVAEKTLLASLGLTILQKAPRIAIISTGDELMSPTSGELGEGQIYDSNSTMLKLLLLKYGFSVKYTEIAKDDYNSLSQVVQESMKECDVIISSGGVSMGDKDFVKPLLKELGFEILFGRVNMKPGKPMTYACNGSKYFFALPGNPVSTFVTFHIFVLPALRFMSGSFEAHCKLPSIKVVLKNEEYTLDSRPEYARAKISYDSSVDVFFAQMSENQMSSRLLSLVGSNVLLMLPAATKERISVRKGDELQAVIINQHFVSEYEP